MLCWNAKATSCEIAAMPCLTVGFIRVHNRAVSSLPSARNARFRAIATLPALSALDPVSVALAYVGSINSVCALLPSCSTSVDLLSFRWLCRYAAVTCISYCDYKHEVIMGNMVRLLEFPNTLTSYYTIRTEKQ